MKRLITSLLVVIGVLKGAAAAEAEINAASDQKIEWSDQAGSNVSGAENLTNALVEWMLSKGGFFSNKIKFQKLNKDDPNSPNGLFALEPIKKNETLIILPVGCMMETGKEGSYEMCDTARNLARQYKLRDKSYFSPYINYLFGFNRQLARNLPSAWSQEGRSLLEAIIGRELLPENLASPSFQRDCRSAGGLSQEDMVLHEDAWRLVISRSWNELMLPIVDMINHRNGRWRNVDQATSAHTGEDVILVALRDIEAGEELYLSYNECDDEDCEGTAYTYVTPHILREYGFVEPYPRRFYLDTNDGELTFEVDETAEGELQVKWIYGRPSILQLNWLRAHLKRLQNLNDYVSEQTEKLTSNNEKGTINQYFEALKVAFEQAILSAMGTGEEEQCLTRDDSAGTCHRKYDALDDQADTLDYHVELCAMYSREGSYSIDHVRSQYQDIEFARSYDGLETSLWLGGLYHSGTSFRPHYHETVIHYPARFVNEIKRVLFMGGGDNMVVHEILKYPSLEIVVGLELDQQVCRSSFKNMGIQPHFDNEKVQWWFGDAAKSLQMLPKDYFGTFDLVLIDLQSYVRDSLMVTKELSLMDTALLLLNPDGVISQNDDFVPRPNPGFAKYTVDLEYHDVPQLCQQSITIGSNTVDFLNRVPKDHKIDNFYLDSGGDHFEGWWNYRKNINRENRHCKDTERKETTSEVMKNRYGVLMILETENTKVPLDSSASVRTSVSKALKQAGLAETSVEVSKEKGRDGFYDMVFILREGYVVVRAWPEHKYCGFDVLLWSSSDKQETAKAELIAAVGGSVGRSSSYRIVTGGMYGIEIEKEEAKVGPPPASGLCEKSSIDDPVPRDASIEPTDVDVVLRKMVSLIQVTDPVIAVLCADQSSPCRSLETLTKNVAAKKVVPVWACPRVASSDSDVMSACENESRALLTDSAAKFGKIGAIVIDPDAPRAMGQIMHKMLNNTRVRTELLQRDYVVLAAASTTQDSTETSWRRALLERFRTEFTKFSPAHRAEVFFNSTDGSLEVGIFSAGDFDFYSHLADATNSIKKETGLAAEVRKVADGIINFIADIEPPIIVSDKDYDHSDAREQFLSQHPLGQQTIFQFEMQAPKSPIVPGERVLIRENTDVSEFWTGIWFPGSAVEKEDGTFDVIYDNGRKGNMPRDFIRKTETEGEVSPIDAPERVLIRGGKDWWYQGSVVERSSDGVTYTVHINDMTGRMVSGVERRDLMRHFEPMDTELPQLPKADLKEVLKSALLKAVADIGMNDLLVRNVADGCVIVASWPSGNAIVSWDGRTHIDVNLFTLAENATLRDDFASYLQKNVPYLSVMSRDEQPRGFGRVVIFQRDLDQYDDDKAPHWTEL